MLPEITQEELSAALDALSRELLAEAAVQPPVNAALIAEKLGLHVALNALLPERGRFMRLRDRAGRVPRGSILVRPDERPERLQWAIAHEIGEATAYRVFDALGVRPDEVPAGARETVANLLAARVLLPRDAFISCARTNDWNLTALKQAFVTASHELIARRMLDFDLPIAITIWDNGRRTFRRANFGRRAPPVTDHERACRDKAHATGEAALQQAGGCTMQVWPIHEPEWKREILRTCWPDSQDVEESKWT